MRNPTRSRLLLLLCVGLPFTLAATCQNPNTHEPVGSQTFSSPQSNPLALSPDGSLLYVANTTSNTVSVVDAIGHSEIGPIPVGIEPVSVAVRPDGLEVWVANHVSDSVSVIDTDPANDTFRSVIATIQDFDANGVTQFDEPVGIAFASNAKAYVALSSRNDIAVIDVASRSITKRVHITAQEPRAITVRDGRLYVAAFESSNTSELSLCLDGTGSAPQCTMDVNDLLTFVLVSPNVPGADARIVRDPDVPDRDLFVFETTNENEVDTVTGIGTLLYGLVVDSNGEVFITQTEARNDANSDTGSPHGINLDVLQNRMFDNQIGRVSCTGGGCGTPWVIQLDDSLPALPSPDPAASGDELAMPHGAAISGDDSTLVVTAAGTSRLFTLDTASETVLDVLDLGSGADAGLQIPKGVVLRSDVLGAPETAFVLNTLENTVSVIDVSNPLNVSEITKFGVGADPTPDDVRLGRIAFNNAFASTSGTFSCESCHPDANTDQLLWRIGGACSFGACSGDDEPRSTMPVRGLKNTLPLHWAGDIGDPFGGGNGSVGLMPGVPATCTTDQECFRELVNGSLSGVMCAQQPSCPVGPIPGVGGNLGESERDNLATFLQQVTYPPARDRRMDDSISDAARRGFADFFMDQGSQIGLGDPNTCADMDSGCHSLPLGVDHDSSTLAGFDAPTMRGMSDRTLQFSLGVTIPEEVQSFIAPGGSVPGFGSFPPSPFPYDPADGYEERVVFTNAFAIFAPVYNVQSADMWEMFQEASTGFSGAVGRQLTLNATTTAPGAALNATNALLDVLEAADVDGVINLRGHGTRSVSGSAFNKLTLSYRAGSGNYKNNNEIITLQRFQLINEAQAGTLVMTLTGDLTKSFGNAASDEPMPLVSTIGTGLGPTGNPPLPQMTSLAPLSLQGIDVHQGARVFIDGQRVGGTIACVGGSFSPYCDSDTIDVSLAVIPPGGLRLLQLQNPSGPLSPEFPFCVFGLGACTSP